jgi:hypothetical protein
MSEGCDFSVTKCDNAMTNGRRLSVLVFALGVLAGLP